MLNRKGFTLIELMITVAVIGTITSSVFTLLVKGYQMQRINQVKIELQRDTRTVAYVISSRLRMADSDTVIIDRVDTGEPPCSRISFQDVDGKQSAYYQVGTSLLLETDAGVTKLMDGLCSISFIYPATITDLDFNMINISITAEKKVYGKMRKTFQMDVEKVRLLN